MARTWRHLLAAALAVLVAAAAIFLIVTRKHEYSSAYPTSPPAPPEGTPPAIAEEVPDAGPHGVDGHITCSPEVQSVWVASSAPGTSGWAALARVNGKAVAYSFTAQPDSWVQLTVGCGGTPADPQVTAHGDWFTPSASEYNLECSTATRVCQLDFAPE